MNLLCKSAFSIYEMKHKCLGNQFAVNHTNKIMFFKCYDHDLNVIQSTENQ